MNITGTWKYTEDFEYGRSEGQAILSQNDNKVKGTFLFTEEVKNSYRIEVKEQVEGIILNNKVLLESTDVTAIQNDNKIDYLPNTFEVHLVSEKKLVGSTFDSEEVCGVFVLEKI